MFRSWQRKQHGKSIKFRENFSFHNLISMQKSLGKLVLKMHHLYVAELDRCGAPARMVGPFLVYRTQWKNLLATVPFMVSPHFDGYESKWLLNSLIDLSNYRPYDFTFILNTYRKSSSLLFCFQNCSYLFWEKNGIVIKKSFWNSRLKDNFW